MAWQKLMGLADLKSSDGCETGIQIRVRGDRESGQVYIMCTSTRSLYMDPEAALHLAASLEVAVAECQYDRNNNPNNVSCKHADAMIKAQDR